MPIGNHILNYGHELLHCILLMLTVTHNCSVYIYIYIYIYTIVG